MLTCPYNVDPLTLHVYVVKLHYFLIIALKHRLWVLVRAMLTCTPNKFLCKNKKNITGFSYIWKFSIIRVLKIAVFWIGLLK